VIQQQQDLFNQSRKVKLRTVLEVAFLAVDIFLEPFILDTVSYFVYCVCCIVKLFIMSKAVAAEDRKNIAHTIVDV